MLNLPGTPIPLAALRSRGSGFVLAASQYTPVLGTAWVAGAATGLAADGINLVTNGESWTGGPPPTGWINGGTAASALRDFSAAPNIAPTGGLNPLGVEVANGGTDYDLIRWDFTGIVGATYNLSVRAYAPSTNTFVNAANLGRNWNTVYVAVTAEDVWQTLSLPDWVPTNATTRVSLVCRGTTAGDVAYFDYAQLYQQRSIATAEAGPNHRLTQVVTMPGAGVVPFGNRSRYQDASNNWYWRITPGTAGTDFELVEVNAGISATKVSADIDWAAATSYTVIMEARGNVYRAWVNGVLKLSYTDATNFLVTERTIAISDGKVGNATLSPTIVEVL